MLDNPVAILVALIGTAGLGGFSREIFAVLKQLRSGISARESSRKRDLVTERDYEYERAEIEVRNRQLLQEYSSTLRRIIIEHGSVNELPSPPKLEIVPDRIFAPSPAGS